MVTAILQMDGVELRTSDAVTCRTLWRLMSAAVPAATMATVEGRPGPPAWEATRQDGQR